MSEFKNLLKKANLTQAGLARLIEEYGGVPPHKTNMSRWYHGETKTPAGIIAFLNLYIEVNDTTIKKH